MVGPVGSGPLAGLAAFSLVLMVLGDFLNLADRAKVAILGETYVVKEDYLLIADIGGGDFRRSFEVLSGQVQGLHLAQVDQVNAWFARSAEAVALFCDDLFAGLSDIPATVQDCRKETQVDLYLGVYSLTNHGANRIPASSVRMFRIEAQQGFFPAYDLFPDGQVDRSRGCFFDPLREECTGPLTAGPVLRDLPPLQPGERLLIPLYAAFKMMWSRGQGTPDSLLHYDTIALSPLFMPDRADTAQGALVPAARPMGVTPVLTPGFVDGKG
jgi:hypothetical protein